MKNLYVAVIVVLFTNNAFSYSCYFGQYYEDIRVADINERQVYTLFTPHIIIEHQKAATDFLSSTRDVSNIAEEEHLDQLQLLLTQYEDTINSEKSDFRQLSSLLYPRQIDWIGVESSNVESELVESYLSSKEDLRQMESLLPVSELKISDLLYLMYPVSVKLQAEYPGVFNKIRIVPLENINLHREGRRLMDISEYTPSFVLFFKESLRYK